MKRTNVSSGTEWEPIVGYSRAVRAGDHVYVSGTTATLPGGGHAAGGAYEQAHQTLLNIEAALAQVGAGIRDVVRTRIYLVDIGRTWKDVGRAHGEFFANVLPATSMLEVSKLIESWMLVEIEAEAVIGLT